MDEVDWEYISVMACELHDMQHERCDIAYSLLEQICKERVIKELDKIKVK